MYYYWSMVLNINHIMHGYFTINNSLLHSAQDLTNLWSKCFEFLHQKIIRDIQKYISSPNEKLTAESGSVAETWNRDSYTLTVSEGLNTYLAGSTKEGLEFLLTVIVTVAVAVCGVELVSLAVILSWNSYLVYVWASY